MNTCAKCGKPLRRVHRSLIQHLRYAAIFQCKDCGVEEYAPRAYRFHFGPYVRCPRCGTVKVVKRRDRDRIDPMHYSVLTTLEWLVSLGQLFHCRFCRIQFYDRRKLSPHSASGA